MPFNFFQNKANPNQTYTEQGSRQYHGERGRSPEDTRQSKDPYEVLQVPRDASQEEIKTAYKDLAGKYHPDKVLHLGEEFQSMAEERFKEIQEAYRELSNKQ